MGGSREAGTRLLDFILETGYKLQNTHGLLFCPKIFLSSFTGKNNNHQMMIRTLSEAAIFGGDREGPLL